MNALHAILRTLFPYHQAKLLLVVNVFYLVKIDYNRKIEWLKAHLVAQGYKWIPSLDYKQTFSPNDKIASVQLLISLAMMHHWNIHQLDIKNAFLHGDLTKEDHMENHQDFLLSGSLG